MLTAGSFARAPLKQLSGAQGKPKAAWIALIALLVRVIMAP